MKVQGRYHDATASSSTSTCVAFGPNSVKELPENILVVLLVIICPSSAYMWRKYSTSRWHCFPPAALSSALENRDASMLLAEFDAVCLLYSFSHLARKLNPTNSTSSTILSDYQSLTGTSERGEKIQGCALRYFFPSCTVAPP